MSTPLDPDALGGRLAELYLLIGPLYRRVARVVEADEEAMAMSMGVRAVLDQLHRRGDLTVPQLARDQALSRQFVQRMVNDAEAAGHVRLVANPAHRRSRLVRLTGRGARAIQAVHDRERRLMGTVGGDLTEDDIAVTRRVLGHMLANVEHLEQARDGDDPDGQPDA